MGPIEKILREAGAIIVDPQKNLKCLLKHAVDSGGYLVAEKDPGAVRWCAHGAIWKVCPTNYSDVGFDAQDALHEAALRLGFTCANSANFDGHAADVYSDAIEAAAELGL